MDIRIVAVKDGNIVLNKEAREGVSVEDILEIAECEVNDGFADYSRVEVNGEIYAEFC